jgi:hypothetical protein
MWQPDHIPTMLVDLAAQALRKRSEELDLEQAVRGLDALSELEFHPLLAAAFIAGGLGVWSEQPYPGQPGSRPSHAERERCDLVISPSPGLAIRDPVSELKRSDLAAATLFASALAGREPEGIAPEEAFWMEVKVVGQHCYSAGVPGPNRTYSSELLRLVPRDIPKLSRDGRIRHGGLFLILFNAGAAAAEHDLAVLLHRCVDRGLPVRTPATARFHIADRIGNTLCTLAIVPVRGAVDP